MRGMRTNTYPKRISDPNTWVDQHGAYLFAYSLMRVRNREMARNLVQETFLAALTSRRFFQGGSSEKTWLVGILRHKIIDQFRKNYHTQSISELQTDPEQTFDDFYDAIHQPQHYSKNWMPEPQALLNSKEFWTVLYTCLDELPERASKVFTRRELEERSTKEICQEFKISPENLWVVLHRARVQLRGLLEKKWREKGVEK